MDNSPGPAFLPYKIYPASFLYYITSWSWPLLVSDCARAWRKISRSLLIHINKVHLLGLIVLLTQVLGRCLIGQILDLVRE